MSPLPCPACQRPNAPGRAACLYCGEALPESPALPEGSAPKVLPADLDQLVARALAGGGRGDMAALRQAMEQARTAPPSAPAAKEPVAEQPVAEQPVAEQPVAEQPVRAEPAGEDAAGADPVGIALTALAAHAADARDAWARGERAAAREALVAALDRATAGPLPLSTRLARASAPAIALPPVHRSHALVIAGLADGDRAWDVAEALETDVATARQLVLARAPKVARRADEPAALAALAARLQAVGVPAVVVTRSALLAQPPAALVLGLAEPGAGPLHSAWQLEWSDRWTRAHDPGPVHTEASSGDHRRPAPRPTLAVPGEVVIRRRTEGRDLGRMTHRRHQQGRNVGERRVPVLDLHGPDTVLRLVHGLTDLHGMTDVRGGLRAFQALVTGLTDWFPDVVVLPTRTVTPTRDLPLSATGEGTADSSGRRVQELSGWPAWEEHSRLSRVLHAAGPPREGSD